MKSGKKDGSIISIEEFIKHKSRRDCWILIDGKVYDVSKFKHPGKFY